jgi:hypothetical protein
LSYGTRNKDGRLRKDRVLPTSEKTCVDCAGLFQGVYNNKRCAPCQVVKAQPQPRRYPDCLVCGKALAKVHPNTKFCSKCVNTRRRAYWLRSKNSGRHNEKARMLTKYAVKIGFLPHPTLYKCVDCKRRQAECYDHRDYSKPLQVDPVCLRCNSSRGKGKEVKFPCVECVAA